MVAVAIAGAGVLGAGASMVSGNKAAKAAQKGADAAAANERYFYDTSRADFAPYREVGTAALTKLADMFGVPRAIDTPANDTSAAPALPGLAAYRMGSGISGAMGGYGLPSVSSAVPAARSMTPGYDGFQASPGYQFRLGEGVKAAERSAAARGLLGSGATMKAIQRYGEGLAASEYEAYANRLAALAGVGQTATAQTTAAGASAANGISQSAIAAGNARASSYANTGNAINSGITGIAAAYLGSRTPKLGYNFGGFNNG